MVGKLIEGQILSGRYFKYKQFPLTTKNMLLVNNITERRVPALSLRKLIDQNSL